MPRRNSNSFIDSLYCSISTELAGGSNNSLTFVDPTFSSSKTDMDGHTVTVYAVEKTLYASAHRREQMEQVVHLAEDQQYIREELKKKKISRNIIVETSYNSPEVIRNVSEYGVNYYYDQGV